MTLGFFPPHRELICLQYLHGYYSEGDRDKRGRPRPLTRLNSGPGSEGPRVVVPCAGQARRQDILLLPDAFL